MRDAETPQFLVRNEGDPIPPVDPEDLKQQVERQGTAALFCIEPSAVSQEERERIAAIGRRDGMIKMLIHFNHGQLLAPSQHGAELDEAVFRVAATFPMRPFP